MTTPADPDGWLAAVYAGRTIAWRASKTVARTSSVSPGDATADGAVRA
jgi:hypothetical protein